VSVVINLSKAEQVFSYGLLSKLWYFHTDDWHSSEGVCLCWTRLLYPMSTRDILW